MTGEAAIDLPPIRHNDYSPLDPPPLGAWDPKLSVSVIIPAYGGQHRLDLTLAALATQTYPDHLMEVIVIDDGSGPPLRLPEIAPAGTRIEPADPAGWGTANAVNTGAALSEGRVIQRLDADMVVCREHIEALARWHHLADYLVTIGAKKFVEEPVLSAAQVHDGVRGGSLEAVFDLSKALASSTEQTIHRTNGLRASRNPYHVCTGPTVSMRREIFYAVGGVDPGVLRGEDTEFAYRLAQAGVVFIPDMAAEAVHLGLPAQRLAKERAVQVVAPYLAQRVPLRRDLRKDPGRRWLVPYVEVVLQVDAPEDQVRKAVSAALEGTVGDVIVTLVAPWSQLPEGRHPVLDDPFFDLRLLREHFSHDERVRLADKVAGTPAPIPFRYTGPVSVPLGDTSLERMIGTMQGGDRPGMLVVDLSGDGTATLERTEALGRAKLLGADNVATSIKATHGVRHGDRSEFWPVKMAPPAPGKKPAPSVRKPVQDTPSQNGQPQNGPRQGRQAQNGSRQDRKAQGGPPQDKQSQDRSPMPKPAQTRPRSWFDRLRTRP